MTSLHAFLTILKANVDAGTDETHELVQTVSDQTNVTGYGGIMAPLIAKSLGYVLDVAVNQGTAEDLRELEENLDNSTDLGPQPEGVEKGQLLGQLLNFGYSPDSVIGGDDPLQSILDAWINDIDRSARQAILNHVSDNWEEDVDEDVDEDEDQTLTIHSTWLVEDFQERADELGVTAQELMEHTRKNFIDRMTSHGNETIQDLTMD